MPATVSGTLLPTAVHLAELSQSKSALSRRTTLLPKSLCVVLTPLSTMSKPNKHENCNHESIYGMDICEEEIKPYWWDWVIEANKPV